MTLARTLSLLTTLAFVGCPSSRPPEPEPEALTAPAPAEPGQMPHELPPELQRDEQVAEALGSLGQLMASIREAARTAAEAETDPCVAARASHLAAIATAEMAELPGGRRPPQMRVAPEAEFLRLCETLSEPLKECARFDVRIANRAVCDERLDAGTVAEREAMQAMVQQVPRNP